MARQLISDSHYGFDNQVRDAVSALGPRQRAKFDKVFPEWERLLALDQEPLSSFDTVGAMLDPEYPSWVADWIEQNTQLYWEDGDLWSRR